MLKLFLVVKLTVFATGYLAVRVMDDIQSSAPLSPFFRDLQKQQSEISSKRLFSMWYVWDGFIYRGLAKADYLEPAYMPPRPFWSSAPADLPHLVNHGRFCFFPGFPLLSAVVGRPLGPLRDLAPLLVSNLAFLAVLYFGYRLGEQLFSSQRAARRFTKFVILIPGAVVLHGAASESLFLAFVLAAFFCAETDRWMAAGLLTAGAALSRSVGVLVALPLAVLACQQWWSHRPAGQLGLRTVLSKLLKLLPAPLACLSVLAYCRAMTGDWFAYSHIQNDVFHMHFREPIGPLWRAMAGGQSTLETLRAYLSVGTLALLFIGIRRVRLPYLVYAAVFALIPLGAGDPSGGLNSCVTRYLAVVFPIAIPLVNLTKRPESESGAIFALATLQGVLIVTWLNHWLAFLV